MPTFRKRGITWTFQITTKDEEGNRKHISKGGFKTKKEAQIEAAKIETKIADGSYFEDKDLNVGQFFAEYLNNYCKLKMNERTFKNRKYMINARIIAAIGKLKLNQVKPLTINKMYQSFLNDNLSTNYINSIHRLLINAFKIAVKWQLIKYNPMDGVDPPKIIKKPIKTWTIEETKTFLKTSKNYWYHIGFAIAIYTGMRRGEILNLKWSNVEIEKKQLTVVSGKTKAASRVIAIPDLLIKELKNHKAKQNQNKLKLMGGYQDNDLVVCSQIGTVTNERNFNRSFYEILEKCDVPKIRLHDLRHTHATILLGMGENPKIVSERLGHSRINITLDTYSHVMPQMQRETANKLNDVMS